MFGKIEEKHKNQGYTSILRMKTDLGLMMKAFMDNAQGSEKYRIATSRLQERVLDMANDI